MASTLQGITTSNPIILLSTELNGLAMSGITNGGNIFSNIQGGSGNAYNEGYLELFLSAPTSAFGANSAVNVWFLTALDGTNFEDGGSGVIPPRMPDSIIPIRPVNSNQRVKQFCFLPICQTIKTVAMNNQGGGTQSLAASGNYIRIWPKTDQLI